MEEQFVPYELALKLKELGFDRKCLAYYDMKGVFYPMGTVSGPKEIYFGTFIPKYQYKDDLEPLVAAPLWQQAFEFFRDKYKLLAIPVNYIEWYFEIHTIGLLAETVFIEDSELTSTYNTALPKAIEKLIQIVEEL